jgi:HEAT repeat protein
VEAIANSQGLEAVWFKKGRCAVIQRGTSEENLQSLRNDLKSPDIMKRRQGAWRAKWIRDVRVVDLLLATVADTDAETSRQAVRSCCTLSRNGLDVVATVSGEKALTLLEKVRKQESTRADAVHALGEVGGERVLPLLENALNDPDRLVRGNAVFALRTVDRSEKAFALVQKALHHSDEEIRYLAVGFLAEMGGVESLPLLE